MEKSRRKRPFTWFPEEGWEDCIRLADVIPDKFGNLLEDIERNEKVWLTVSGLRYMIAVNKFAVIVINRQ